MPIHMYTFIYIHIHISVFETCKTVCYLTDNFYKIIVNTFKAKWGRMAQLLRRETSCFKTLRSEFTGFNSRSM